MKTKIAWTDYSQNFIKWFCTKTSPGCKNCYMFALAKRYPANAENRPVWRPNAIKDLYKIPSGAFVFVGDMYDQYHEQMPVEWIHRVHNLAAYERPDLQFQMLTKRIERVAHLAPHLIWPDNLWMGCTVENAGYTWRLDYLRQLPAKTRFISFEPLLGDVGNVDLTGIDMVIVGAESGAGRRPFDKQWARNIRGQCRKYDVAFFYKQSSGMKPGTDPELDGQIFHEFPRGMSPLKGKPEPLYRAGKKNGDRLMNADGQIREIVANKAGRHGNLYRVVDVKERAGKYIHDGSSFTIAPEELTAWMSEKSPSSPSVDTPHKTVGRTVVPNSRITGISRYIPLNELDEIDFWQESEAQERAEMLAHIILSEVPFQTLVNIALFSPNQIHQKIALWCIGISGKRRAAPTLWKFIKHPNEDIRDMACLTLDYINSRWGTAARRVVGHGWGWQHYHAKPIQGYAPRPTQLRLL